MVTASFTTTPNQSETAQPQIACGGHPPKAVNLVD